MILLLTLLILLVVSYKLSNRELISPSFLFTSGMTFCALWYVFLKGRWESELRISTFFVIVLGTLEFIIVAYFVERFSKKRKLVKIDGCFYISTKNMVDKLILAIEISTFLLTLLTIIRLTGQYNLPNAIYAFRHANTFTTETYKLPHILTQARRFCNAAGYWYSYIIISNYYKEKRKDNKGKHNDNKGIKKIIILLSIANGLVLGGRGDAINLFIAIFVYWYMFSREENWGKKLKWKQLSIIIILLLSILYSFQFVGNILGRDTNVEFIDYIGPYCGAQFANLNKFLERNNYVSHEIWGSQTFFSIVNLVLPRFSSNFKNYTLDLPFLILNGHSTGNVYTIFYPFIYDFGYLGVPVLVFIMAWVSQIIYVKCKNGLSIASPSIAKIIYSYMASGLALAFFSNKFYEQFINIGLIYRIIFWIILNKTLRRYCKHVQ